MAYGTLSVADLLATSRNQTVAQVGEDRVWESIESYLAAHNAILNEQLADLVERTTERLAGVGGVADMSMEELDEFGRADAQKVTAGALLGFPLRLYGVAVQWTRKWFANHTPAELVAQIDAAMTADILNVQKQIKRAIFIPTNYTFVDKLIDRVEIPVKALVNADGMTIPSGPNGETFNAATHTHYLARASTSLAASDVTNLLATVAEHYNSGDLKLYINQAQESTIRGFTSNFTPYVDARIIPSNGTTVARGALDQSNIYNRAIGVFDQAEVWVKPWIPAGYLFAWMRGQQPPLAFRERRQGSGDFQLDYENEQYPLRARQMGREFGIGVRTRINGAVLYAGDTVYAAPSL